MSEQFTRRDTLKTGLTAAGLLAFAQERAVSAPSLGETDVPFTDYPKDYKVNGNPKAVNRFLDIRKIDGHITPNDQFFFIQHLNRPEINSEYHFKPFYGFAQHLLKPRPLRVPTTTRLTPMDESVHKNQPKPSRFPRPLLHSTRWARSTNDHPRADHMPTNCSVIVVLDSLRLHSLVSF